jgi:hypothetical protein
MSNGTGDDRGRSSVTLTAASSAPDAQGTASVVLFWAPAPDAAGYNLYRTEDGANPNSSILLNGQPITTVRTCAELESIVPRDSADWRRLAGAFTAVQPHRPLAVVADERGRAHFADSYAVAQVRGHVLDPDELSSLTVTPLPWEIDPCDALSRGLTPDELKIFKIMADCSLPLRLAYGLAYVDRTALAGHQYSYELRAVSERGKETPLAAVAVTAGQFTLPDPPSSIRATPDDAKVLVLWNRNPFAFSYQLRRSTHPAVGYQPVHSEPIQLDVEYDLDHQRMRPTPGLVDFQRWDDDGWPVPHDVHGTAVYGPANGVPYYYQVASVDVLGRCGAWSASVTAIPVCSTPPATPTDLRIQARDELGTATRALVVTWRKCIRNADGHRILDATQSYEVYRGENHAELEDIRTLAAHLVATVTGVEPTDATTPTLEWADTDLALAPPYGEKDFWYRVRCVDEHGSVSGPSALVGGRLPDVTPPGPTKPLRAEGFADHIRILWPPNTEPDLAGYQVYRGICDRGAPYRPDDEHGCDMVLVGTVVRPEADERVEQTGSVFFDDHSVPPGSPLCYSYWVRAYDAAQNLYAGTRSCPLPDEYVCQRLLEQTPPPPPVITRLRARNRAVLVDWVASPVQDLRAFHVYRSDEDIGEPVFVGCVLSDGTVRPDRWTGVHPSCADIPAEANLASVRAGFLDETVEPGHIYWYRVSALDWLGNESEGDALTRLPAISTFTYSSDLPATPSMLHVTPGGGDGCGLEASWLPPFDSGRMRGFVVFRSSAPGGDYRQVSPVVAGNSFRDESARRGVDYWYRVQAMDAAGALSPSAAAVKLRY